MEVTIDTSQLKILEDFFNDLSKIDQDKIWVSAFRKADEPLKTASRLTVPVGRGNLWRSIGSKTTKDKSQAALIVGSIFRTPYVTKQGLLSKVWYGILTEGGTKERYRTQRHRVRRGFYKGQLRGVSSGTGATGSIKATHWFARAYNMSEDLMNSMIKQEWYNAIDRFIANTNRKLSK